MAPILWVTVMRWHMEEKLNVTLTGSSFTDPSNPGDVDIQTSGWEVTTITSALKFYLRSEQ